MTCVSKANSMTSMQAAAQPQKFSSNLVKDVAEETLKSVPKQIERSKKENRFRRWHRIQVQGRGSFGLDHTKSKVQEVAQYLTDHGYRCHITLQNSGLVCPVFSYCIKVREV